MVQKVHVLELNGWLNNTATKAAVAKKRETETLQRENAASAQLAQAALESEEERERERLKYKNTLCRLCKRESGDIFFLTEGFST